VLNKIASIYNETKRGLLESYCHWGGLTPKVTLVLAFEKISIGMFYMVVYIVANEFFLDSINNFYHYAS
jgi:hypothetical protein